ncbi:unnamed protein product [Toxocara canis]|uniref:Zinc finger protein n=1 Tax=Toxocara canis TaxID=6265 RepID=A0A183VB56_TOXCA|nr:unnamed protein product [Toxocara canis]
MNFHKSISVGTRRMLDLHAKRRSSMKQNQSTSEKASTPPFEAQETQSKGTGVQLVAQVKQEKEQDDDVIILDEDISSSVVLPASVPASLSAAAKQVSETVSAAESIAAQQAVNSEGQQAQSVPVPINFMANVRLEQDAGHVDQSRPLYEQSHEEAPVIDIPIETQEEAINSVLEKLITAVVDATEQTDERSATGVTNTPVLSPSQVDDDADEAVKENKDGASQGSEYIGDEAKLNGSGEHDDILIIDEPSGDDSDQVSPVATTETGATVNLAVAETQEVDVSRTEIGNGEQSSEVPTEDDDDEIQILDVVVVVLLRSEENGGQDREQCVSKPQVEDEAQKEEVMGVVVQKAAEESVRIRDVVDDGDEDLQVIGVGEGPGLQFVKRREARVQCPNCTARFMTHAALEVHSSSHRYDAGNTISSVYGVPQDQIVFICRLCCLAYESKAIYEKHMRTHGLLQNCQHCAVVAFNEEQMKQHVPQHAAEGQRLTYVCAFCATTYTSDERVYHHMMRTHGMVVMYFCKNCGSGSTNGQLVYAHISRNECGSQVASMFHYQPANETRYVEAVNAGALVVVVPSECVHRSFLMPQNEHVMMTCPQCHGLRVLSRGPDDSGAILTQLVQLWRSGASRKSQDNGENRQSTAPIWQPVLAATDTSTTSSVRLSNANTRALRRRRLPDCDAQAQQQQMVASRVATVPPQHGQQRPLLPRAAQQRPSVPPTDTGSQALMQSAFSTAQNLPPSVNATAIAAAGLSATARAQQHFLTTVAGAQQTVAAHTSSSYGNVQQRAMAASSGNMQISRRQACAVSTGGARYDNVAQVLSTYGHGMQQAIQQHAAMSVQIPVQSNASNAAIRVQSVPLQNVQYTQRQASAVSVPQFAPSPMLRASAPTTSSSYVLAHQQNGVIPAQHPLLRAQVLAFGLHVQIFIWYICFAFLLKYTLHLCV